MAHKGGWAPVAPEDFLVWLQTRGLLVSHDAETEGDDPARVAPLACGAVHPPCGVGEEHSPVVAGRNCLVAKDGLVAEGFGDADNFYPQLLDEETVRA